MTNKVRFWIYINSVLAIGLLLGIFLLIDKHTQSQPSQVVSPSEIPEFFINGANTVVFDQKGHLISNTKNDRLDYYSKSQRTHIDKIHAIFYTDDHQKNESN